MLHRLNMASAVFLLMALGEMKCPAFSPPLQNVSWSSNGNSLQFQVYDTARQQWMLGRVSVTPLSVRYENGVVAWTDGSGHVGFAVYDPNAATWEYGFGSWSGSANLSNLDGVVAWGSEGDAYENYATYDPYLGSWQFGSGPGNAGLGASDSDGIVAWVGTDIGAVFAVYDPSRSGWRRGSVESDNITIINGAVTGMGTQTYTIGYSQNTGRWVNGTTPPFASFVASSTSISGCLPVGVWFTDMSIGGASWNWNFGDGSSSSSRSTYHVYNTGGSLASSLTVIGTSGTSTANLSLVLPPWLCTTNNGAVTITGYAGPGGAVTIPNSINGYPVTSIGSQAFYKCISLTSVTIPNSVTSIKNYAFYGCHYLTNITIGKNVTSIGAYALAENISLLSIMVDASNSAFSSIGGILFNKDLSNLIQYPGAIVGSYAIPNSVNTIIDGAFAGCGNLNGISIPNSVNYIGGWAFSDCYSLTNILIPKSVTRIGGVPFLGCTSLNSITVAGQNVAYSSLGGVLYDRSQTTLVDYPPGLIGDYAIPNGVTSIGNVALYGCSSLTGITIPNTLTSIGGQAFEFCSLTNVTIPGSVASIGSDAFESCTSLSSVYFQGNAPSADSTVFFGDDSATAYYLPGTSGWGRTFGGIPTAQWMLQHPVILNNNSNFSFLSNAFGFTISWATNISIVVEGSTNLLNWQPLQTNMLNSGTSYFRDPQWTNYPGRFYRISSP